MKRIQFFAALMAMAGLTFAGAALAQHEQHQQHGAPQAQQGKPMPGMMTPGAMHQHHGGGAMMQSDNKGCAHHQQVAKLTEQLTASFAALEKETGSAVLKQKLAAHGALLKELQTTTSSGCPMMQGGGAMSCGMMGGEGPAQ